MKVLLTGSSGMVGRNLTIALQNEVDLLTPTHEELDLEHSQTVNEYVGDHSPDFVIHAAGRVGGIEANRSSNSVFLSSNVLQGINLVNACNGAGVPSLLNLGSSCMYPKDRQEALSENALFTGPLEPTNEGYAIAKLATAQLCRYISRETPSRSYKTAIPCNLYGEFDSFDPVKSHMVAAAIRKVAAAVDANDPTVEIWGDGTARRENLYIGDLVEFVLRCLDNFHSVPELVNVGLGTDASITEHYEVVARVVGFDGSFLYDKARPAGMSRKLLDCSRATKWGWTATTNLEEGVQRTYEYFRATSA